MLVRFEGSLEIDGTTLVEDATCFIERDARIHLRGRNGSGKSTLLSAIAQAWNLHPDRLLYLPQEWRRSDGLELLERLSAMDTRQRGRVLQIVARLGTDPDVLLSSPLPSPGEARKLAMAIGIGVESWMLLLDEPTNHLDLDTMKRLETALADYPGAMLMVSHDHRFAEALTDQTWSVEDRDLRSG